MSGLRAPRPRSPSHRMARPHGRKRSPVARIGDNGRSWRHIRHARQALEARTAKRADETGLALNVQHFPPGMSRGTRLAPAKAHSAGAHQGHQGQRRRNGTPLHAGRRVPTQMQRYDPSKAHAEIIAVIAWDGPNSAKPCRTDGRHHPNRCRWRHDRSPRARLLLPHGWRRRHPPDNGGGGGGHRLRARAARPDR